ncbi:uncharacterized protein B0P05DRAFT_590594 [Gilbertella persicaria]|uniref:uncharacterized protein n=1 Tax=Gilbertella persicaria TaxID=101096 RepID=UPI00221EB330|nr:uncharacterized protein B0P05DRAFT_590594 [Gilbertella persicaria]KAI8061851.1 hypothetical protein B0P05DRAFT_590594 [Gilbertella persicaria]
MDNKDSQEADSLLHQDQQAPTSLFSNFVSVISGARQTASQEFTRFWETLNTSKTPNRQAPLFMASSKDSHKDTSENIYNSIIPDYNRRSCIKDAEIQTDFVSEKRKYTSEVEAESRPQKLAKRNTSPPQTLHQSITFSRKRQDFDKEQESPRKIFKSTPSSPIKHDVIKGSKSVKRLTLELEEALSPRFPAYSPSESPRSKSEITKPSSPPSQEASYQLGSALSDVVSNSPNEDEDVRLNKLTETIRLTRTRVSELMASSSSPPRPSHTLTSISQDNKLSFSPPPPLLLSHHYHHLWTLTPLRHHGSPIRPNDKHKSKMRELIQLIPNVRLRKTDTIIGPDGREKPNPFWNEIYNPKRRVF